jgi:hypothetical protein
MTDAIKAAIIESTGHIVGQVLTKAPGHNEAIAAIDTAVKIAMDSLIKNAKEKLKVQI